MKEHRYWDSSVFVALLNNEQGRAPTVVSILDQAEAGRIQLYTSALTITEVLKLKGKKPIGQDAQKKIVELFQHEYIQVIGVDRWIAFDAQQYVWENNVPPKDSIHVATALKKKLPILETYDNDDLISKSGQLGNPPIVIRKPVELGSQPGLFDKENSKSF